MVISANNAFICKDVDNYDCNLLKRLDNGVQVPVTYHREWNDGFGARGWKLNATIDDPDIIASTRETGQRVNTSVLVHDILDHFLSGFSVSGHRSEAMALIQLSQRTGADPQPDFKQMIYEDIFQGRVNGETLRTFLPENILKHLPSNNIITNKDMIAYLKQDIGEKKLVKMLIKHFFKLGCQGEQHACDSWQKLGLDKDKQKKIGLALQALLVTVDFIADKTDVEMIEAFIGISNTKCCYKLNFPKSINEQNIFFARLE